MFYTEQELEEADRRERWVSERAEVLADNMRYGLDLRALSECIQDKATERFAAVAARVAFPSKAPYVEYETMSEEMDDMIREYAFALADREADAMESSAR